MMLWLLGCVFISKDARDEWLASLPDDTGGPDEADTDTDTDADTDCDTEMTLWRDEDGDGFGAAGVSKQACEVEDGWVANDDDCDDADPDFSTLTNYLDADGDGYGTPAILANLCVWADGYSTNSDDCDDSNGAINPAALEPCDDSAVDYDCDGRIGECSLAAGTALVGDAAGGRAGASAAFVDLLTEDAYADVAVGVPSGVAGQVRIIRGRARPTDGPQLLSLADASSTWTGSVGDRAGETMVSADFTGDGTRDLVVGAPDGDIYAAWAGQLVIFEGPLPAGALTPQRVIQGDDADDQIGQVLGSGDLNADGVVDLAMSSPDADNPGAAYVFFGPIGPAGAVLNVSDLTDVTIAKVMPREELFFNTGFGAAITLGDLDADGTDDFIIGHTGSDVGRVGAGAVYVCAGPFTGVRFAEDCEASVLGALEGDAAGTAVVTGDFNRDGATDLVVGAPNADAPEEDVGAVYIVNGGVGFSGEHSVLDAQVTITGQGDANPGGHAGSALGPTRDLNGDGNPDLFIGAPSYDDPDEGPDVGGVWVIMERLPSGTWSLDAATDRYLCETSSGSVPGGCAAGAWLGGGGDFDGDGFQDTLVGATGWSDGDAGVGATAIVFGSDIW